MNHWKHYFISGLLALCGLAALQVGSNRLAAAKRLETAIKRDLWRAYTDTVAIREAWAVLYHPDLPLLTRDNVSLGDIQADLRRVQASRLGLDKSEKIN